jgi:hypothetical protein
LTKGLLEEVIRSHMLADPNTIVEMRNSEDWSQQCSTQTVAK